MYSFWICHSRVVYPIMNKIDPAPLGLKLGNTLLWKVQNNLSIDLLSLYVLFSHYRGSRGILPFVFYKLCIDMHVSKTEFERNSTWEYYHMTCIGKTNIQVKEVYWKKHQKMLSFLK